MVLNDALPQPVRETFKIVPNGTKQDARLIQHISFQRHSLYGAQNILRTILPIIAVYFDHVICIVYLY